MFNLEGNNFVYFSFSGQNGKFIYTLILFIFLGCGAGLPLVKEEIIEFTNLVGYRALLYFSLILANPSSKSEAISLILCNSPFIIFRLYLLGIFELQCTGSLNSLETTLLLIVLFSHNIWVSKNFFGAFSTVNLKRHAPS